MKKILNCALAIFLSSTTLQARDSVNTKDFKKLQKEVKKLKKELTKVKIHDAKDNIKLSVDLRTAVDRLEYKSVSGKKYKNNSLMSNRLWIGMAYRPLSELVFRAKLSYYKAYGATPTNPSSSILQRGMGFDKFDWVINENLSDSEVRVREAYWLYYGKNFLGSGINWTASLGRRPSTNGFLVSMRDDDRANSPLGHNINMEFDGASLRLDLEKITQISGSYIKGCYGRGVSNAKARFSRDGADYTKEIGALKDVDLAGFIFVPYYNGQYEVMTTYYKGRNLPGFVDNSGELKSLGSIDGAGVSLLVDGIGDGINSTLDNMKLFISLSYSKTHPNSRGAMLGSNRNKSGTSYYMGANWDCLLVDDARVGVEYNHGSKYWRSFTYGEDTLIGSKLSTRGDAYELFWTKQINKAFSFQARWTKIEYDYTGSQGFFGMSGTPMSMDEAIKVGLDPINKARDIRLYLRYRY